MVLLRTQQLVNDNGLSRWATVERPGPMDWKHVALILCDVWDLHWSRGATQRLNKMVSTLNDFVNGLREKGVLIVHSPSDTLDYYRNSPARNRIRNNSAPAPQEIKSISFPPLPIDDSDGGSDSGEASDRVNQQVWSRQHPAIVINDQQDVISDSGNEIYAYLKKEGIEWVFYAGVHANMCILNRSFGIKNMLRWGFKPVLIRDLVDIMYNPAKPPYVNHDQALKLVVEYIEKFGCPSACSTELLNAK